MGCLTKQEWRVVGMVLALLLTGWIVKSYRAAHWPAAAPGPGTAPVAVPIQPAKP